MNFIPYLFKKDLLRSKILLLVWFLLILAQSALSIGGINLAAEFLEFQMFLPLLTKLFSALQGLMIIVIVPLIMQDDSLVGTTSFWLTRPISRKGLLITKLCLILTLLVALPLIAEMIVLAANGTITHHIMLAIPEILLEKLTFIIPFLILAAVTPKFSKYALVGIIVFAVLMVFGIVSFVAMMFLPISKNIFYNFDMFKNPSLEASCGVAEDIYVIVIGFILVIHQFLSRYTARTVRWFIVGYLIMIIFSRAWNWDFLKETSGVKSSVNIAENISIGFNTDNIIVSDEFRFRKKDAREKSIRAKQTIMGLLNDQFAILKELDKVKMKYPDGKIVESKYVSTRKKETISYGKFMAPLQAALGDVKLLNPFKEASAPIEVFTIEEADFNYYKNESGTYLAHAEFDIFKYKISSHVPLKQGARNLFGSEQIIIYDILERPNGVTIIIAEKKANLLFDRTVEKKSRYDFAHDIYSDFNRVYLIANKKRNEAFLAEVGANLYMMEAYGPTRLETKAKQFDFTYVNDRNPSLLQIDKEWLKDAELIRLDAVKIGAKQKDFTIENFVIPAQSTKTSQEIDEIDQQLRLQDKKMKEYYPK